MKNRLIELLNQIGDNVMQFKTDNFIESLADHLLANGVIVPPCKVGDYIEWDNGLCKKLHEVKGFNYCPGDLGLRFEIGICSPVVNHSAITRILTREEAEQALAERSGE